jgi:hypothetical protein
MSAGDFGNNTETGNMKYCEKKKLSHFHFVCLFVCLFPCRYSPLWLYFHSPVAGFGLLVFEVS